MLAVDELTLDKRSQDRFLYEQLVRSVAGSIASGALGPGHRLLSVRKCAQQNGVSVSTVLIAYRRLEDLGLVEARPQSGFYVKPEARQRLGEARLGDGELVPNPVRVSSLAWGVFEHSAAPEQVLLGHAVPDPSLLPTEKLGRLLAAGVRAAGEDAVRMKPQGIEGLRAAIARRLLEVGFTASPDEIVITSGCVESIGLSLRAIARPGDAVAVESPAYFAVLKVLESLHLRALEIPTRSSGGIDLAAAERVFADGRISACVVTPNGHNPTGAVMSEEAKERLVELSVRHRVPLIEDDAQGDLCFDEPRPRSLRSFDGDAVVLHCSSFSKVLAPGYRVGWIAAGPLLAEIMSARFASTVCAATPSQYAIAAYLEKGGLDHHLRSLRKVLSVNLSRLSRSVKAAFPPGTRVASPRAGTVLWVRLPDFVDALELHRLAVERGIGLTPGPIFSAAGRFQTHIRLNGAMPWSRRLAEAVVTIGDIASGLQAGLSRQAILDWLEIRNPLPEPE